MRHRCVVQGGMSMRFTKEEFDTMVYELLYKDNSDITNILSCH